MTEKIFNFTFYWLDKIAPKINLLIIFLLGVADRVTLVLVPSEIIVPFAGFLVAQGRFGFWPMLIVVNLGTLAGEALLFWISMKIGRWFFEKYGQYLFVSKHDLEHVDRLFKKHGGKIVFWGRIIPVARMLIAIPAGISRMPFGKFILYTFLGMLPYNLVFLYLGYLIGDNRQLLIETTDKYFGRFDLYGAIILVILIVWYIWRHINKKHASHD